MFCLDSPLLSILKGQWFCHTCLFGTGGDFGFDEGEEHSLSSFQARDLAFRKFWFLSHPPAQSEAHPPMSRVGNRGRKAGGKEAEVVWEPTANRYEDVRVTEDDVQREFWTLVKSSNETVEIEYGADVHSTTHGRFVSPFHSLPH